MVSRSALIALTVGTILTAINQGDVLFHRKRDSCSPLEDPLTYAVPFVVATLGAMTAAKVPPSE